MSESRVFRRSPGFRRTEIIRWDHRPIPVSVEPGGLNIESLDQVRLSLHRERQNDSSLLLSGTDTTRRFEFRNGWECTIETSLSGGFHKMVKQQLIEPGRLQLWVIETVPDSGTAMLDYGVYRIGSDFICGGGPAVGEVDIHRVEHGLFVSTAHQEVPERREWRLQQHTPLRLRVYDVHEPDRDRPSIIVAADDTETMTKTVRLLVYELTGLMVDPRFLVWAPLEDDSIGSTLSPLPVASSA